jgi:hypothetical protein
MKIISKMQNNNFLVVLVRRYLVRISLIRFLIRKLKHTANKVLSLRDFAYTSLSTILGTATIHCSLLTIHYYNYSLKC